MQMGFNSAFKGLIFTLVLLMHLHLERKPHPSGFSPKLFCALSSVTYPVHLIPDFIDCDWVRDLTVLMHLGLK
jgi:hypothetical protein